MPMWRCPHCGTPQAETARCWVCRRSSTACATCRDFRRSVAGQLGYCGRDRNRDPLQGDEIRACWQARPIGAETAETATLPVGQPPGTLTDGRTPVRRREFVEVGARPAARSITTSPTADTEVDRSGDPVPTPATDAGWSLWGDADF